MELELDVGGDVFDVQDRCKIVSVVSFGAEDCELHLSFLRVLRSSDVRSDVLIKPRTMGQIVRTTSTQFH